MTLNTPMTELSDERLTEMLAGLEGVTPGPWKYEGSIYEHMGAGLRSLPDDRGFAQLWKSGTVAIDAAHIARCDPDTIRSLITELQSLRSADLVVRVKGLEAATSDHFADAGKMVGEMEVLASRLRDYRPPALDPAHGREHHPICDEAADALISATTRIQRAERERDEARQKFYDLQNDQSVLWVRAEERATTAEAQLADAVKVLELYADPSGYSRGDGEPYDAGENHPGMAAATFLSTIGEKPDAE